MAVEPEAALVRHRMHVQYRQTTPVGMLWKGTIYGQDVVLLRCGMGPERAAHAMTWLVQAYRLQGAVSVGFAGGLHASVATGDAILPSQILTCSTTSVSSFPSLSKGIQPDVKWAQIAASAAHRAALTTYRGPLVSVNEVVPHAAGKARLGWASGALAVDMETYTIGRIAAAHHLPFAVLRTIFDACGDAVPLPIGRFATADGGLRHGSLARYLLRQPQMLLQMLPLWHKARRSGFGLENWLDHFFSLLSLDA